MRYPSLDRATRKALNGLTLEEIDESTLAAFRASYGGCYKTEVERTEVERSMAKSANYPYNHEILWYGVDAVVHVHLMREALDISAGKVSLADFMTKFALNFNSPFQGNPCVPMSRIRADGIFIPPQAQHSKYSVALFNEDYNIRVGIDDLLPRESWPDKEYARKLIKREWSPSDLECKELVEQGVQFGKDMWNTCMAGYKQYKEGKEKEGEPQAQVVTNLARKLITYYEKIVNPKTSH